MERRVFQKPDSKRFRKLRRQLSNASNEEEVRLAWVRSLEATLGITFDAERGKRDLSYNNAVIEFRGPGKFNGKTTSSAFQEAVHLRSEGGTPPSSGIDWNKEYMTPVVRPVKIANAIDDLTGQPLDVLRSWTFQLGEGHQGQQAIHLLRARNNNI